MVAVGWIFAISAIAYLDRVNISIAGSSIQKEFRLDNLQLGWVFSSFVLGYALFQAPGGRLADRFGPRKILAIATVWWAVFTALFAMVPASIPGRISGAAGRHGSSRCRRGHGIPRLQQAGSGLDSLAGAGPSQRADLRRSGRGRWSNAAPDYVYSSALWLALVLLDLRVDRPRGRPGLVPDRPGPSGGTPWVKPAEAEYIRSGMPKQAARDSGEALPWRVILGSREVWALTLSYFAFGYVSYIFFTWFFIYLNKVRGLERPERPARSSDAAVPGHGNLFSAGGYISDRLTKRYGKRAGRCGISVVSMAVAAGSSCLRCRRGMPAWPASCWRAAPARCISRRVASGP